jgi:hypothetical protein
VETLEERLAPAAAVSTDRTDYGPGSTAVITGAGFDPNETVNLQVVHTDTGAAAVGPTPWTVTADVSGAFHTTWYVNPIDSPGASFTLSASGSVGDFASTTFTDSADTFNNNDGTTFWSHAANWSAGLPTSSSDVAIPSGQTAILDPATLAANRTINSLTVSGTLDLETTLTLSSASTITTTGAVQSEATSAITGAGSLTNNGNITANVGDNLTISTGRFNSTGSFASVNVSNATLTISPTTFTNFSGGTLTGGAWNAIGTGIIYGFSSGITTLGTGTAINLNGGNFYTGTSGTNNALTGLSSLVSSSALFVNQNSSLTLTAGTLSDSGTVEVETGGSLALNALQINNGGVFQVGTGSSTSVSLTSIVDNGSLIYDVSTYITNGLAISGTGSLDLPRHGQEGAGGLLGVGGRLDLPQHLLGQPVLLEQLVDGLEHLLRLAGPVQPRLGEALDHQSAQYHLAGHPLLRLRRQAGEEGGEVVLLGGGAGGVEDRLRGGVGPVPARLGRGAGGQGGEQQGARNGMASLHASSPEWGEMETPVLDPV